MKAEFVTHRLTNVNNYSSDEMKSSQEILAELRENVMEAKEQLIAEKKALYKVEEMYTSEKEKWAKEIKTEQVKIHNKEKELKRKESKLATIKAEYEEKLKRCADLESENEKLRKEIQKIKQTQHTGKELCEISRLEKILSRVQERQNGVKMTNKWVKSLQERDLKVQDTDDESKLNSEVEEMSCDFSTQLKTLDENLREIEEFNLKPKQQKLRETQETLARLKSECEEMEKKNKSLEAEIALLQSDPKSLHI
ncbi:hypothetical protein RUM44_000369 [Polyplax serrata]|uniref:Uncharacterized protein n=1 Tax=Polyplax serrata TaxID=468196 RepID=A0ABR1B588_POLSC